MELLIELIIRGITALFSEKRPPARRTTPPPIPPVNFQMPAGGTAMQPFHQPRVPASGTPMHAFHQPNVPAQRRQQGKQIPVAPRQAVGNRAILPLRGLQRPPQRRVPIGRQKQVARSAEASGKRVTPPPLPISQQQQGPQSSSGAGAATARSMASGPGSSQPVPAAMSSASIRQLIQSRPNALRSMWILSEVLQPPLALRDMDSTRG